MPDAEPYPCETLGYTDNPVCNACLECEPWNNEYGRYPQRMLDHMWRSARTGHLDINTPFNSHWYKCATCQAGNDQEVWCDVGKKLKIGHDEAIQAVYVRKDNRVEIIEHVVSECEPARFEDYTEEIVQTIKDRLTAAFKKCPSMNWEHDRFNVGLSPEIKVLFVWGTSKGLDQLSGTDFSWKRYYDVENSHADNRI